MDEIRTLLEAEARKAEPPDLGLDRLTARIKRRRTRRNATALVGSASAMGAVAVATATLMGGGSPQESATDVATRATPQPTIHTGITTPRTGPPKVAPGVAVPYDLYAHCGIKFADFLGRRWVAINPPPPAPWLQGSDINYVSGTMTLIGPESAQFRSPSLNKPVDFRPTTDRPPACD